jgi:TorA maturation chaperone TorD
MKGILVLCLGVAVQATPARATAQSDKNSTLSKILGGLAESLEAAENDEAIRRAYRDALDRDPSEQELRRYRVRMKEDYWSEADVRNDLRKREDYYRPSEGRVSDPERIIRRAYEDILHREPDPEGLRLYRSRMIDDNWTERDVREALRKSPEQAGRAQESADKVIRRAYQDVLGREPDYNGLVSYRNKVLDHGWTEHDVEEALRGSPEYRQKNALTESQAQDIVRRAYEEVLGREPDAGSRGYVQKVLRDHWSEQEVARELRHSDEYRNKHR